MWGRQGVRVKASQSMRLMKVSMQTTPAAAHQIMTKKNESIWSVHRDYYFSVNATSTSLIRTGHPVQNPFKSQESCVKVIIERRK